MAMGSEADPRPGPALPTAAAFAAVRMAAEAAVARVSAGIRAGIAARAAAGLPAPDRPDLAVTSVQWRICDADIDQGDVFHGWRVVVGSVDPAASDPIERDVRDALAAAGHRGIEVVTEW